MTLAVPDPYESAVEHRYPGERVLWQEEGVQTTVSIHETFDGGRAMYLDGLHQASTHPDVLRFHRLIGALPATLHPEPRRALVVGLGGGATPGALATVDGVRVDIVELSEEVVRGARLFADVNYDVIDRANVHIRIDDARNYLLLSDRRYDVVTADLIVPTTAGAGKLWSVEYWELARDALAPGGIMLQWVGDRRPEQYRMIVRSFQHVFPHTTAGQAAACSWAPNSRCASSPPRSHAKPMIQKRPPCSRTSGSRPSMLCSGSSTRTRACCAPSSVTVRCSPTTDRASNTRVRWAVSRRST